MSGSDSGSVLSDYPNPRANTFLMMRFSETAQHREILTELRRALAHYGLNGLRADDKSYHDALWANVKSYMDACDLGIAVFEKIYKPDFNPNVSLELGYMLAQRKRVLLLKEKRLSTLPSDVVGNLYRTFDSNNISASAGLCVMEWLRDVGVAKSAAERVVLFVSHGGTCRCAMAKVALDQKLVGRRLPYRLRTVSVAHKFGGTNEASKGARRAVSEAFGADLLVSHRVTRRNPGLLGDADLILVMEDGLRKDLPEDKTFLFKEFLGLSGDVRNPWPDDEDEAANLRYEECMHEIQLAIETGVDRILELLESAKA